MAGHRSRSRVGEPRGCTLGRFAPLLTLAGEALFVLPWLWLPMMAVFVMALRRGPSEWRLLAAVLSGRPPIVVFALISAWSSQRVLFHWAAPGYLMLFPLLGDAVAHRIDRPRCGARWPAPRSSWSLAMVVVATQVRFDWLHPAIAAVARKDPDIDAVDWTSLRDSAALCCAGRSSACPTGATPGRSPIALGPDVTVLCLNRDCRQFGIAWPPARFIGADMLILAPEHRRACGHRTGSRVRQHRAASRCIDPPCRTHVADGGSVPGQGAACLAASRVMA